MTANRDLKRRVRDRQAQTGESYVTALQRVLAQRPSSIPSAIPTIEFVDLTELAASLQLKCRLSASPALARIIDAKPTLERFHELLVVNRRDPALSLVRGVALQGEYVELGMTPASLRDGAAFLQRVRAGLGGVSANGRMLALRAVPRSASPGAAPASRGSQVVEPDDLGQFIDVLQTGQTSPGSQPVAPDEPVALFSIWFSPMFVTRPRPPLLIATLLGEDFIDPLFDRIGDLLGKKALP
jgi:hypothetical protein